MPHAENQQLFEQKMDEGLHCSQCVLTYFTEKMGLNEDFVLRLSSGLGMGANHGDSCGAVTGAIVALGLTHGFTQGSESWAEGGIEEITNAMEKEFIKRNGSVLCRDLLSGGYDAGEDNPSYPDGVNPWENCAKYCADAVELAEAYIDDAAIAKVPPAITVEESGGQSNVVPIAAGSGIAGLAVGAGAMAVVSYERRRAENEARKKETSA